MTRLPGVVLVVAALATPGWRLLTVPPALGFPADQGAHPAFRTEWWYTTATLTARGGSRYGVELTFFREGLEAGPAAAGESALRARQLLAAHLGLVEMSTGRVRFAQRVRRAAAGLAAAASGGLDVFVDDWAMRQTADGAISIAADDRDAGVSIRLDLRPEKPLVLHGDHGLSRKGPEPGNASVYVSFPRLAAHGTLSVDGRAVEASGQAWFDHEWGTSQLGAGVVGWDWFGLRLGDGRELMLYRLRRADGSGAPESAGTLVERDGTPRRLSAADFAVAPSAWWVSPRTSARYPARWRVAVPGFSLDLDVRPEVADAELDARRSTGTIYWEGPVAVTGSTAGEGYAELTGYATSLAGRF